MGWEEFSRAVLESPWLLALLLLVGLAVIASFLLSGPSLEPPRGLQANVQGYKVLLTWEPVAGEISGYSVFRATSPDFSQAGEIASLNPTTLSFADYPVPPGTYYYWVVVYSPSGEVKRSDPLEVVVEEAIPRILSFSVVPKYTNRTTVLLKLSAENVDRCRFKTEGEPWGSWMSVPSEIPWVLPTGDGWKELTVECSDVFNNRVVSATVDVYLDTVPPSVETRLYSLPRADSLTVYLYLNATDNLSVQCFAYANGSFLGEVPQGDSRWDLPPEDVLFSLRCKDRAGNWWTWSKNLSYEGRPNFTGYILLENNASETEERVVDLYLYAPGASKFRCAEEGEDFGSWQEVPPEGALHIDFTLSRGGGLKTVICQVLFFNQTFNLSDSIVLVIPSENPSLRLESEPFATTSATVRISWANCHCSYSLRYSGEEITSGPCEPELTFGPEVISEEGTYTLTATCGRLERSVSFIVDRTPPTARGWEGELVREPGELLVRAFLSAYDSGSGISGEVCTLLYVLSPDIAHPWDIWLKDTYCGIYSLPGIVEASFNAHTNETYLVEFQIFDRAGNFVTIGGDQGAISPPPEPEVEVSPCGGHYLSSPERIDITVRFTETLTIIGSWFDEPLTYHVDPDEEETYSIRGPPEPITGSRSYSLIVEVEGPGGSESISCSYSVGEAEISIER